MNTLPSFTNSELVAALRQAASGLENLPPTAPVLPYDSIDLLGASLQWLRDYEIGCPLELVDRPRIQDLKVKIESQLLSGRRLLPPPRPPAPSRVEPPHDSLQLMSRALVWIEKLLSGEVLRAATLTTDQAATLTALRNDLRGQLTAAGVAIPTEPYEGTL